MVFNQKQNQKQKKPQMPVDSMERTPEKPKRKTAENKVEQAVLNFTRLPEKLLEMVLKPMNYTSLNTPEMQEKLHTSMEEQDQTQEKMKAVRERLQQLRQEETEARQYFEEKDKQKEMEEEEENRKKAMAEEEARQEAAQSEPTTKQKRGMFGKKPKKTVENKPSQGKQ